MIQKGDLAMGRAKRQWVSQLVGSFHIISRVAGGTGSDFILQEQEKEYFLELLERFASGFFVQVHAFTIMSNISIFPYLSHWNGTGGKKGFKKRTPKTI